MTGPAAGGRNTLMSPWLLNTMVALLASYSPKNTRMPRAAVVLDALRAVSADTGLSVARVALAWVLTRPFVTSVIIGAKNVDQLKDNIAASDVKLSPEHVAKLDAVSALPREYPGWMLDWQNRDRRPPTSV